MAAKVDSAPLGPALPGKCATPSTHNQRASLSELVADGLPGAEPPLFTKTTAAMQNGHAQMDFFS